MNNTYFFDGNTIKVACVHVFKDTETSENAGAGGTFQIESIYLITEDDEEIDISSEVDQGTHFYTLKEVGEEIGLSGVDIIDPEE